MGRFIITLSLFCASAYGVIDVTKPPYNVRPDKASTANQTTDDIKAETSARTNAIAWALQNGLDWGQQVYFPEGTYSVNNFIARVAAKQALVMRGAGRAVTTIKLTAPLDDHALIEAVGGQVSGAKSKDLHGAQLDIRDITFDAMADDYHQPGHRADAFRLNFVVYSKFESVTIKHFNGAAIHAANFWDSAFNDVHFIRSGSEDGKIPAVVLRTPPPSEYYSLSEELKNEISEEVEKNKPLNSKQKADLIAEKEKYYSATNNISFTGCQWEGNFFVSLRMMEGARKILVRGNKFHGLLRVPKPFGHLQMFSSNSNVITENNFTHSGANSLTIGDSFGNIVSNNTIGGQAAYGIDIWNSPNNTFTGNVINIENSGGGLGDVRWLRNWGSRFTGNVTRRRCQLQNERMVCQ